MRNNAFLNNSQERAKDKKNPKFHIQNTKNYREMDKMWL